MTSDEHGNPRVEFTRPRPVPAQNPHLQHGYGLSSESGMADQYLQVYGFFVEINMPTGRAGIGDGDGTQGGSRKSRSTPTIKQPSPH